MDPRESSTNSKVTELSPLLNKQADKRDYVPSFISNSIIEIVRNELEKIKKSTRLFSTRYPRSSDLLSSLDSKEEDHIKTSSIESYIRNEGKMTEAILTVITKFCTSPSIAAESIKLLLNQNKKAGKKVGFNDLNELDVDKLKVILSRPTGLQAMFENKIIFESLKELDADKLEVFLSHPDAIRMIYENTVTFEDLKDLGIEKLKVFLSHLDAIEIMSKSGIKFDSLKELDADKLEVFLSHPDAIEIMSKSKIKFDSLKELDTNKLKAFLSNEDRLRIMFESKVEIDSEDEFAAVILSNKDRLRKTLKNPFKFDHLKELDADKIEVCLSHPNEIKKIFMIKDCFDKLTVLNSAKLEVCLSDTNGTNGFRLMLENDVNFDSVNELDTEKLAVFLSHPHGLREMFENNVNFDSLKELDTKKLKVFLSNKDGLKEMFKNKVTFDSLKELDTDKLEILLSYPMGLQKIYGNRINFNQLKKLSTNKIQLLLWHRDALQEMFNNGVSFEQLKSLDIRELRHLLVYSDESVAILTGSKADHYKQNLGMLIEYMFSPQRDDERIKLSVERLQLFKSEILSCLETTHDDETLNRTNRDHCSDILKLLEAEQYASARNRIKNLFDSIDPQNHILLRLESSLANLHGKLKIALDEIDFNLLILEGMIKDNKYVIYDDYYRIDYYQPLNPTLDHLYRLIENNDFSLLHMLKYNHFQLNKLLKNKDGFLACIHGLEDDVRGRFISEFKAHFLNKNIGLDISCPPQKTPNTLFKLGRGGASVDSAMDHKSTKFILG